jgi:N-acetylneuraminic acid mutarotase
MKWERVKVKHKPKDNVEGKKSPGRKGGTAGPGKKWGHTANTVKNGRYLYVFGGYGKDDCQTQDIYIFDSVKQTWTKPNIKGHPPTPRDSHTCVTMGEKLYVFGGTDGTSPLDDLHVLDTVSNVWSAPNTTGHAPCAREGHAAAVIGTRMYIFGGCGKLNDGSDDSYFNDLYYLETAHLPMYWVKVSTTGTHPAARDSHSMSSWNNKLIILGGEDASNSFLSDIYILDTDTFVWKELRTSGQKIIPRAGHTTVALRKYLFVFGGFTDDRKLFDDLHVLNVDNGVWTRATTSGIGPSPRFSLAGDVVDPERGILLFVGGCNENLEALDDMYYLDTEMKLEKTESEPKREKLSLRKELKRKQSGISGQEEHGSPVVSTVGSSVYGMFDVVPVAERTFEAKITDVFHHGFTIEATIDNKPLRGLLFSYKPGFAHAANDYISRKKAAEDAAVAKEREHRRQIRKQTRLAKQAAKRPEAPTPQVTPATAAPQAVPPAAIPDASFQASDPLASIIPQAAAPPTSTSTVEPVPIASSVIPPDSLTSLRPTL